MEKSWFEAKNGINKIVLFRFWHLYKQGPCFNYKLVTFKGGFFSESAIRFLDLQISKKKYSKKLSWTWNLKFRNRIDIIEDTKKSFWK